MASIDEAGKFYLGRFADSENRKGEAYLFPAKNLTTHAVCVGMTGSGKTGLCIDLLEEAVLQDIPAIIVDPKGDMSNLLLHFPKLSPEEFLPWISQEEASAQGKSREELAAEKAESWKKGLADWGIDEDRFQRFGEKLNATVYTPGGRFGRPLSMNHLNQLPEKEQREDEELLSELVEGTIGSLFALTEVNQDKQSGAYLYLTQWLHDQWSRGQGVDLQTVIMELMKPSLAAIGVLPVDTVFPEKERTSVATKLNAFLASSKYELWMKGDPLDISGLLQDKEGKARISILSIAHLDDNERQSFVTDLLYRTLAWMRLQPGTDSLRALLYMDEIAGFFPPVENPPSKMPLLMLLKQARAFGLGVVLATQNPVDLDYKGLSNMGTWMIGRLQTEQDKNRLLDGLDSANGAQAGMDRKQADQLLSTLPKRTFLIQCVHDQGPILLQTRWAMSYLAGPLTRDQLKKLTPEEAPRSVGNSAETGETTSSGEERETAPSSEGVALPAEEAAPERRPQEEPAAEAAPIPNASDSGSVLGQSFAQDLQNAFSTLSLPVPQRFLEPRSGARSSQYRPKAVAVCDILYEEKKYDILSKVRKNYMTDIRDDLIAVDWSDADRADFDETELSSEAPEGIQGEELPKDVQTKTTWTKWQKNLEEAIYQNDVLELAYQPDAKLLQKPDEDEESFRSRIQEALAALKTKEADKLQKSMETKIQRAEEKIRKQGQRIQREEEQAQREKMNTVVDIGSTILDSLLGSKRFGKTTMNKMARTARTMNRSRGQNSDVEREQDSLQAYQEELDDLQRQLEEGLQDIDDRYEEMANNTQNVTIRPKKTNIHVQGMMLVWVPEE